MGTADLHIHSIYSPDATTTVRAILKQAADVGLDVIAIADHDEMRGSLEAQELAPRYGLEAVPAAEVSTSDGHLVALFIKTLPPAGMTLNDTLIHIGRQGGVAIAPHPFNNLPNSLSMEAVLGALTHPGRKRRAQGHRDAQHGHAEFRQGCPQDFGLPAACQDRRQRRAHLLGGRRRAHRVPRRDRAGFADGAGK
ncbi:MAG: PHP domain-containing protein [Chloroflexi bacterium]|nr:PHP domain-containing protein [Chloroflexota bacterium]